MYGVATFFPHRFSHERPHRRLAMADDNTVIQTLPQPKTFAPSREDVLSSLAFFFGDPATPEKLKDYSEHRARRPRPHHHVHL